MRTPALLFIASALALGACSGNFGTGTNMPNTVPPVNASAEPMGMPNGQASPGTEAIAKAENGSYPLTQAPDGFPCPDQNGFSCSLRFNVPPATPTPAPAPKRKGKAKPTPTPTPTPTPSPSPSPDASASALPTATPSPAGGSMALKMTALPKDAPAMVHVPQKALNVVALMEVTLSPSADFALTGPALAQFTLPKEQLDGRGFALQLFERTTHRKKHSDRAIWTFDKSDRQTNTLTFAFTPPKITVPKGATYLLVLYGDDRPATPAPSGSPSATPAATVSPSPGTQPSAPPSTTP